MESIQKWLDMGAAGSWEELLVRFIKVAVIGFVVLQAKEYFDAGTFDTIATGTDALLIAGGVAVVDMILMRRT